MRTILLALALAAPAFAQLPAGLGRGYEGELEHASRQLIQLAEAVPEEKYAWRPAPGVRSFGEVYVHIFMGNFMLLDQVGHKAPQDLITKPKSKGEIVAELKRSLAAVQLRHQATSVAEMRRAVKFLGSVDSTVENVYLRILVHLNEHMGQAIAYARMSGIAPPWSKTE